jgi:hypothetical protein
MGVGMGVWMVGWVFGWMFGCGMDGGFDYWLVIRHNLQHIYIIYVKIPYIYLWQNSIYPIL